MEIHHLLTPQLPPKQRAAASEPLAVSSQRLHLLRWAPLTSLTMGFRHILPIFYQYSTNNSKAFPRYFWNFQEFPRYSTQWKHRIGHFLVLNHSSLGSSHTIPLNHWNVHAVDTSRAAVEAQELWPGPLGISLPNKMFEESKRSLRFSPCFSIFAVLLAKFLVTKTMPSVTHFEHLHLWFWSPWWTRWSASKGWSYPWTLRVFHLRQKSLDISWYQRTTEKKKNMCGWFTHGLSSVVSNCQQKSTFYYPIIIALRQP